MRGRWIGGLAIALAMALTGCSSMSGRIALFPEGHRLIGSARSIRNDTCPAPGTARELDKQLASAYVIEPGDVLLVQPASLESPVRLPGDQPVLPDGSIQLGRHGRLIVAGKTIDDIEMEINRVIKNQIPDCGPIIVRLVTRDSKVFYVLGEVNAPGAFPLRGRETSLDAIIAAGGLNTNASRRSIILVRPTSPDSCRIVLPVDYNAIVQLGDTTTNYHIKAGDRIFVPTRTLWEDMCAMVGKGSARCRSSQLNYSTGQSGAPVLFNPAIHSRPFQVNSMSRPEPITLAPIQTGSGVPSQHTPPTKMPVLPPNSNNWLPPRVPVQPTILPPVTSVPMSQAPAVEMKPVPEPVKETSSIQLPETPTLMDLSPISSFEKTPLVPMTNREPAATVEPPVAILPPIKPASTYPSPQIITGQTTNRVTMPTQKEPPIAVPEPESTPLWKRIYR